jgi:hypothetical protein
MQGSPPSNPRRQQVPNPIIDQLYGICQQLTAAMVSRDEKSKWRLWQAFQSYYIQAQRHAAPGEQLPWPDETTLSSRQLETRDIIGDEQIIAIIQPVMEHIERKWQKKGLSIYV